MIKKFLIAALFLFTVVSSTAQAVGELPAGAVGTVNYTTPGTYQNYTFSFTAPTTGIDYFGLAFRQDPGYWGVGNFKLNAMGSSQNLLSNPNLQYGGTVSGYGLQAPANWGVWYQSAAGAPPAAGYWYAPGTGWMGTYTGGLGVNTSTSGTWIDGAVGSYDGIYQGFSATAGTTYQFSFSVNGTNSYSNPDIMIGVYAGACTSGSTIFSCSPVTSSGFTAAATPQATQGTGGAPPPEPPGPPPPAPTAIYNISNQPVYITRAIPTTSNSPAGEGPNNAFDHSNSTKYLNFDKKNAGVTVQLNSGRAVTGFTVTTANDFSGRDPTSYKLYGSNDGSTWTMVKEDTITLSDTRYWTSSVIDVANTTAYVYYFMLFPTTKAGDGCGLNCNSMQIAEITYYYDANSTVTSTATSSTIVDPVTAAANTLCCGGSAAPFSSNTVYNASTLAFVNRTTADSKVYIEQVGNANTVTVDQSGTKNNYAKYYGNGSNNDISITQSGNVSTNVNYTDISLVGNSNRVSVTQQSTGGAKGAFITVNDSSNNIIVQQKDNGSHYAEVNVSGGNKSVDITQQGSASHMASVTLTGPQPASLSLTQSGSTQQFYSITSNCTTAGGCARITVAQGQ
jgi:hypothetical protein